MWSEQTLQLIRNACDEDLGRSGDISARLLPGSEGDVAAGVVSRTGGICCGLALGALICRVFGERLDAGLAFEALPATGGRDPEGQRVEPGQTIATVRGPRAAVLGVERTLLNFLGRMSGVATLTRRYLEAAHAANPRVQILDTRKTIPGWRELDKYAVRIGGGTNHRLGLYDAVLIKDNHLVGIPVANLARALSDALERIEGRPAFVEVEVDRLEQLAEVCAVDAVDVVLLDNFALDELRAAVGYRDSHGHGGRPALEASGNVTLKTVGEIAGTGVERISVGALTHSAASLDFGLDF